MSFLPGFSAPTAAWLALLFVPLIVFYFLKLRRPRLEIPSLVLWRQVLNDQRVNSPFQRFKRNLLLLLQLLLLLLLVLAAMQPFLHSDAAGARAHRRLVLIDCSASMAARGPNDGRTRLDLAKVRVRALIDNLLPGQELALVSFTNTARRRADFTADARTLREALAALEVEDLPSDLGEALRLAAAVARGAPFDSALLISDGNFPAEVAADLAFHLDFERLPAGGTNLGITALSARRAAATGDRAAWEIFVQVEGSRDADWAGAQVELRKDGQPLATAPLVRANAAPTPAATPSPGAAPIAATADAGGSARQVFRVDAEGSPTGTTLEVRLLLAGFDALAADNRATLRLPVPRVLRVFVPPTLPTWRRALVALADNSLDLRAAGGGSGSGNDEAVPPETPFDLVITDQPADLSRAAGVVCSVGFVPEDLQRLVEIAPANATNGGGPSVIDWRRDADVLRHVELGDLVLLETPVVRVGATDADFNNLGYEILAQGGRGPLVLERRASAAATSSQTTSSRFVALLFNPDKSTLPYRVGFPVLVANLLDLATRAAGLSEVEATRTGPAANRVGDEASLLSPLETSLASVESIRFNEQITTTAALVPPRRERSLWFPLALGAFALLMVEWWAFHARPG